MNNVNTTMQTGAGQEIASVQMMDFYDKNLITAAVPLLIHDQFGQKRPVPKNSGRTIIFRKLNPFPKAVKPLAEGVTPDGRKLDWTKVESTLEQYGDYVTTSDMLTLTSVDNTITETQRIQADQAGRTLDTVTREVINAGMNVQYGDGVKLFRNELVGGEATGNDYLTVNAVKLAAKTLKNNNAPRIKGEYICITHPNASFDLMSDPKWENVKAYSDPKDMYAGEVGRLFGVRFVETTEAKIFSAAKLAAVARNLTVKTAVTAATQVVVNENIVDTDALAGRSVIIGNELFVVTACDYAGKKLTLNKAVTAAVNAVIYPGEGGAKGRDVYASLVIGSDAYGVSELEGGGLKAIIKTLGSAGTSDPLDQRSSIGWKAAKTTEILADAFIVRIEHTTSDGVVRAN